MFDELAKPKMGLGFTLVEVLVIVAIFSLIASFVSSRIWDSQVDARDAQRKRDLNTLRTTIGIFRDQKDRWPNNLNELKTSGIINLLPEDPSEGKGYGYSTSSADADVCLKACMEEANNADSSSVCSSLSFGNAPSYIQNCASDKSHYLAL